MSRIDELKKQHPTYALSAVDIFKMISPNQSNKYIEMLIKLHKQKTSESISAHRHETGGIRPELIRVMTDWGLDYNYLETFDNESLYTFYENVEGWLGTSYIKLFSKFSALNERKLIENNDVTSYSDWKEIEQAVALAEVKLIDKALEKQIKKVYEDDEWLSLRPLSLEASMKYGANTKWCTTTNTGQYYARYSSRGILIYNINKKTGYKVACFKNLDQAFDNEFSWWDVTDRRIEALDSEAPAAVLEAIRNEIKDRGGISNEILMSEEEQAKLQMYKDGNYRPGNYEEGPSLDRAYRSGGIIDHVQSSGTTITNWPSTGTGTIYTYNPNTFTVSSTTTDVGIGLGTSNPTAQIQVHGDLEVRDGNIRFTSEGVERARLTANGMEFTAPQEYNHFERRDEDTTRLIQELTREMNGGSRQESINEQVERRLFPELLEDDMRREAQQRLDDAMAEQLASANERVAQKHLSLLDNIELGTLDNDMKIKMQMLAGIKNNQRIIQELEADIEQLRSEEAQPEVVHSSIWNKIKNTGRKLGKRFTSRSRKQIGALPRSVSARLEAVKQSQEL